MLIRNQKHRQLKFEPQIKPHKFPKNRQQISSTHKIITILIMILFYQILPFFIVGLSIYSILTLNYYLIGIFIIITLIQIPLKRSLIYCKFLNQYLIPTLNNRRFQRYFQQQITTNQNQKYLFALHPHSVITYGMIINLNLDQHPLSKMTLLGSRFALNYPFLGGILKLWGVQTVNSENLNKLMKQEKPIGIPIGGFQQATLTTPNQYRIYVKKRKGFIKYALRYGYTIYPTLIMNQHKAYWTFDYFKNIRLFLNKFKMPGVFFLSQLGLLFPINMDIFTVVGKGIKCSQLCQNSSHPSHQQINKVHQMYTEQIKRVYEKYKILNDNTPLVFY